MKGLAPHARYSMVIKGNAYGHGIEDLLPLVEACGVDHFAVFSVAEAKRALKLKREECERMITVSSFGDMNNSLNDELLARLPQHIPRYANG